MYIVHIFKKFEAVCLFIHSVDLILMPHDVDLSVSPACVKRNLNEECFFRPKRKEGRLIATSIQSDEISQFFFFAKSSDK